ncbi:MAG: hypothetical protein ACNI3A_02880 [Desulfovibrio sp.]|uniref:hypothetical protein n=1 Tax=Desulfovibrio sp. 7SRBS1 TaxID=3378064 RepID=UPI003B3F7EEA
MEKMQDLAQKEREAEKYIGILITRAQEIATKASKIDMPEETINFIKEFEIFIDQNIDYYIKLFTFSPEFELFTKQLSKFNFYTQKISPNDKIYTYNSTIDMIFIADIIININPNESTNFIKDHKNFIDMFKNDHNTTPENSYVQFSQIVMLNFFKNQFKDSIEKITEKENNLKEEGNRLESNIKNKYEDLEKIFKESVEKLGIVFQNLKESKRKELWIIEGIAALIFLAIFFVAYEGFTLVHSQGIYTQKININRTLQNASAITSQIEKPSVTLPPDQSSSFSFLGNLFEQGFFFYLFGEAMLIYLFRILLTNYYTARDEYIQLQIREALCKFIPTYKVFAEDKNDNLHEFATHIFSPINSRLNPTPHPMDFLGQITDAIKKK